MILETFYAYPLGNGAYCRETKFEEFATREELDTELFFYIMSENIGYKIYDCTLSQYGDSDNYKYVIEQKFDKYAYISKGENT